MQHFFVKKEQVSENEIRITGSDVNHIKNVLRLRPGDEISVSDSDTVTYRCEVREVSGELVTAQILWAQAADTELPNRITLYQALPKSNKMELIIQKAVELGAYEIVPVETRRTVVRLDEKRAETKLKRWNAISESAAKQAKRSVIPKVRPILPFKEAVREARDFPHRLIPYERARGMQTTREALSRIAPGEAVAVFIGPEGGFAPEEIEEAKVAGLLPISLGRRILRTETAGMTVLSMLMLTLEQEETVADESI